MVTRDEMLEFLLKRKFPDADLVRLRVQATRKQELASLGDVDRRIPMAEYDASLRQLAPEALEAIYRREHSRFEEESARVDAARAELVTREEQSRFFHQAYANADFEHWGKLSYWTLDEAVALSLGKAPEVVNWDLVKDLVSKSTFAHKYSRIRELVLRAKHLGRLHDPVLPSAFLEWAKQLDVPYPAPIEEQVMARGDAVRDWKRDYDALAARYKNDLLQNNKTLDEMKIVVSEVTANVTALQQERDDLARQAEQLRSQIEELAPEGKPIGTRERGTLLKLIIGMAIGGYRYNPKSERNSATTDIIGDLERLGIEIGHDTVLKKLREAAGLLPQALPDEP